MTLRDSDRAARLRQAIAAKRRGAQGRPGDIGPRPDDEPARLGEWQRGLWFVHRLEPQSAAYNLCSAFAVEGALDITRLERAVETVVHRHRLLRSSFRPDADGALQILHDRLPITAERIVTAEGLGRAALTRAAAEPFDLEHGPLVRLRVIQEASGTHYLLLALHHILADERSLGFLWREIAVVYERRAPGSQPPAVQYDDYVHWRRQLADSRLDDDLAYWQRRLDPLPEPLRLPFERPSPATGGPPPAGSLIERRPGAAVQDGVRRLAAAVGATPFMICAFAFRLLLARYTDGQPVAFGTPVSMRSHPATADMIGYFLNPIVIGTAIDQRLPVRAALEAWTADLGDALAHAAVPFDLLAARLAPRRALDHHPIFQVMFVYQEAGATPALGQTRLHPVTLDLGAAKFDLTLFIGERDGSLETAVEYRSDRFDAVRMERLLEHYEQLLAELPADPGRAVADVPLLTAAELAQLAAWECGPPLAEPSPPLVTERLHEQARLQPQHQAVVCGGTRQDYASLEAAALAIAGTLIASGIQPGSRVALFLDRSVSMIAGLVGALLAGAAYVPMDPAYPQARNHDQLEDADVSAVLTTEALRARLPAGPWTTIAVDRLGEAQAPPRLPHLTPDLDAYLLYTSGSTGRPKGVRVTHDNLRRSTQARLQVYPRPPARFLLLPSVAFDSSVAGIFWTLTTGGTLVVPTDDEVRDAGSLARLIDEERVASLLCVPSLYLQLLDTGADRLRHLETVIVAGEICPPGLVDAHFRVLPRARLYNEYGPTEATVWASVHRMTLADGGRAVPIGRPIPGVRVEVRDGLGRPVPAGIPGHGWIAGPTVARGYWRRDEVTAERFVNVDAARAPASRRYRTGDRMLWTDAGALMFLGRDDEQIKLRGYRIEPGEIEAALLDRPGIEQAAVVAWHGERSDAGGSEPARLVAFVVAAHDRALEGWRPALTAALPDHMIPARLVVLTELPRLPNGKVDRARLRSTALAGERLAAPTEVPSTREQALISLWEGLLGRYGLGPDDNFFERGGHSLQVIQMVAAIERDFEVALTAADVFQAPTVRALALRIGQRGHAAHPYEQLFPIQSSGSKPPFIMAVPDFFAEALAVRFRGERPVYGVRGVSLRAEGNRGRWPTLTHLAEEVADEIQRRFGAGPSVLAGYSFGAWLAIETVRVLERRGVAVRRLYVIAPMPVDFYCLGPFRARIDGLQRPLAGLGTPEVLRHFLRSNHPLTNGPWRRGRQWLTERPWRRILGLTGALRRRAGLSVSPRLLQADVRVERFRLHATYRPGPVSTPTTFFNPIGPATDSAATWRPYFRGPLTVQAIPDPHDDASVDAARKQIIDFLGEGID